MITRETQKPTAQFRSESIRYHCQFGACVRSYFVFASFAVDYVMHKVITRVVVSRQIAMDSARGNRKSVEQKEDLSRSFRERNSVLWPSGSSSRISSTSSLHHYRAHISHRQPARKQKTHHIKDFFLTKSGIVCIIILIKQQ